MDHRPLLIGTALLLVTMVAPAAHGAPSATGWYPAAGPAWVLPLGSSLRDTYTGGLGLAGGIGYAWSRHLGSEVRLGWFRRTGSPDARLAESASSRVNLLPFTAEVVLRGSLARAGDSSTRFGSFIAAGPAVVFSRERFTYRFAGTTATTEGRRSDPAVTMSAGLEGPIGSGHAGWRLVFRYLLAGGHREVLRPGGRSDERGSLAAPTQINLGFELTWR